MATMTPPAPPPRPVPAAATSLDGVAIHVTDRSRIGEARRLARGFAEAAHQTDAGKEEVAIVASELAANLVDHAAGGWFIAQRLVGAVDLYAIDRGPGMTDVEQCFVDGYSTTATSGIGLGAIRRLSTEHAVDTGPDAGTVVFARCGPEPGFGVAIGAATRPYPGQRRNGDGWSIDRIGRIVRVVVLDGLGHGPPAADATDTALAAIARSQITDPVELLGHIDHALAATRGAAATVVCLDLAAGTAALAGVGNVGAVIDDGAESVTVVPRFGVLGSRSRLAGARSQQARWIPGARLVLHTDGISDKWRADRRRGTLRRSPGLIAGRMLRDHARRSDDATVLVIDGREG